MPTDESFDRAVEDTVAKILQLPNRQSRQSAGPMLGPALPPPSLQEVVEACVAELDATASLDDLVAKVRATILTGVYEDWAQQAFRDAVAAIAETRR